MSNSYPDSTSNAERFEPVEATERLRTGLPEKMNSASFSIQALFQITTACALFFACHRVSPILAIGVTAFVAPAIIRTGLISEMYRRNRLQFGLATRLTCFASSLGVVVLMTLLAGCVFVATSLLFGLFGMVVSTMVGSRELSADAAVVGTAGGMVWGMAAAMLAVGYVVVKTWLPKHLMAKT